MVMKGIPNDWLSFDQNTVQLVDTKTWSMDFSVNQTVVIITKQTRLAHAQDPLKLWQHWEDTLQVVNIACFWKRIVQNRLHITKMKLRDFYVRYIYQAYALNPRLMAMKHRSSPNCSLCNSAPETRVHLFWDCSKVRPIWEKIITFCQTYVDKEADYCQNNCLLPGFGKPVLNLIVTQVKYEIHCARLFNRVPSWKSVLFQIRKARINENILCAMVPHYYHSKWS